MIIQLPLSPLVQLVLNLEVLYSLDGDQWNCGYRPCQVAYRVVMVLVVPERTSAQLHPTVDEVRFHAWLKFHQVALQKDFFVRVDDYLVDLTRLDPFIGHSLSVALLRRFHLDLLVHSARHPPNLHNWRFHIRGRVHSTHLSLERLLSLSQFEVLRRDTPLCHLNTCVSILQPFRLLCNILLLLFPCDNDFISQLHSASAPVTAFIRQQRRYLLFVFESAAPFVPVG